MSTDITHVTDVTHVFGMWYICIMAVRGQHKHVVSPYDQFQDGWHTVNSQMLKYAL